MTTVPLTNWARNVRFRAEQLHRPSSIAELQQLVSKSARVRALGTGHSFNEIADTTGDLVSVAGLPTRLDIDAQARTVTVSGGTRFAELGRELHQAGFAIPNTASLPHISVAGGCSTGTHGSGETVGNLSSFVSAVELVTADGDLITCSRETDPDRFDGTVVALGALGIVTALTFDLVPTFHLRQDVYDGLAHESFSHPLRRDHGGRVQRQRVQHLAGTPDPADLGEVPHGPGGPPPGRTDPARSEPGHRRAAPAAGNVP
jgi:xylitol oxidase